MGNSAARNKQSSQVEKEMPEIGDRVGDQETSPLQIDLIILNLLSQRPSSPSSLCKLRSISTKWRELSLAAWRSTVTLNIVHAFRGLYVGNCGKDSTSSSSATPFETFLDYLEDPENQCLGKPFRHYHFHTFALFETTKRMDQLEHFWKLAGEQLISLKLSDCSIYSLGQMKEDIRNWSPNLKQLKFLNCEFDIPIQIRKLEYLKPEFGTDLELTAIHIEVPNFRNINFIWLESLTHVDTLADITIYVNEITIGSPFQRLAQVLHAIRFIKRHGIHMQMSEIFVHPGFNVSQDRAEFIVLINILQEFQLPLRSLNIKVNPNRRMYMNSFPPSPQIDWDGLQKMSFVSLREPSLWRFPFQQQPLAHLQTLIMSNVLWPNMGFLKFTPNLEKLAILYGGLRERPFIGKPTTIVANTCKAAMVDVRMSKLETFFLDFVVSEEDLSHLIGWFPNVRKLRMVLNNKQFAIVCQHWSGLVELGVLGNGLTDGGVTGLKILDAKLGRVGRLRRSISLLHFNSPPVSLLPHLTKLTCMSMRLTDASIFHGFTKIPTLRYLIVQMYPSDRAKRALEKVGVQLEWTFHIPTDSDPDLSS